MITILIMVLILKRLKWLIFSGVISPSLDFQPNPILTHPPTRHFVAHREGSLSAGVLKVSADNRRLKFHLAEPANIPLQLKDKLFELQLLQIFPDVVSYQPMQRSSLFTNRLSEIKMNQ